MQFIFVILNDMNGSMPQVYCDTNMHSL